MIHCTRSICIFYLLVGGVLFFPCVCAARTTILNVVDFGAVGDARSEDTQAIQRAISEALTLSQRSATIQLESSSRRSETVIWFPPNLEFVSGPLHISGGDYLTLQIDGTLTAITNETEGWENKWPQILPLPSYGNSRDGDRFFQYQPFLYITNSSHFVLRGQGLVDGKGQWWWDTFQFHFSKLSAGRPNLVRLVNCTDVEITGVTLKDSPFWCLHPVYCSHVHIHHVHIQSPLYAHNSDGIDPDSCQHVMIEYNDVSCGDDHIAIKAGVCGESSPNDCRDEAWSSGLYTTKNVTVRYNTFRTGMGVAVGSEMSGGVEDVLVHDNILGLCPAGHERPDACGWSLAMHLKTTVTRGGFLRNITFSRNTVYNTTSFLHVETDYQSQVVPPKDYTATKIDHIVFRDNRGLGSVSQHASFGCSPDVVCDHVTVQRNTIPARKDKSTSTWSCSFVSDYQVDGNYPPGLQECMDNSWNNDMTLMDSFIPHLT
jgi:polygalacturonase